MTTTDYKTVAFHTLGCKLNFSETSAIARSLETAGFAKVEFDEIPALYIINTCSVTENADKECRHIVRKALRINPEAFIVVTGCYAQLKPVEIASIPGVDLVLGAGEKFRITEHIDSLEKKKKADIFSTEIKQVKEFVPTYSFGDRTRSFLKVQDGCDYFCSFCTIPLARGTNRSMSISETLKIAQEVAVSGVKEVVLTGVNIGDFGKQSGESFLQLIQELDKIEGIERFRISSIEPNLLADEIIHFVSQSKKFVPHFHIPLQSGSDKILKLMRRRYTQDLYAERVARIKELMPHCCIGTDVIVGFPGESEGDFLDTYRFLNELNVSYLHVFTYSERANTTAIRMDDAIPAAVRQERNKMFRILSEKKKRSFYEENIGSEATVLFETENHNGIIYGYTENYIRIKTKYNPAHANRLVNVVMRDLSGDGMMEIKLV